MRIYGILVATLIVGGCDQQAEKTAVSPPATRSTPTTEVGRYVIVHSPQIERDTVLLDTATGKTWQQVTWTDLQNNPTGWTAMARDDNDEEMNALRRANPIKGQHRPVTTSGDVTSTPSNSN